MAVYVRKNPWKPRTAFEGGKVDSTCRTAFGGLLDSVMR